MSKSGLELLSAAWGLPLSELEVACCENDDDWRSGKMGWRQPADAGADVGWAPDRPVERS